MAKRLTIISALLAVASIIMASLSLAHAASANVPGTNQTASSQAYTNLTIRVSSGTLIVRSGYQTNFTFNTSTDELQEAGNPGNCLYSGVSDYYIGGCNASNASDVWGFGSNNRYSEMWTGYNEVRGDCAWSPAVGGDDVFPAPCNGNDGGDRWNWHS